MIAQATIKYVGTMIAPPSPSSKIPQLGLPEILAPSQNENHPAIKKLITHQTIIPIKIRYIIHQRNNPQPKQKIAIMGDFLLSEF